MGTADRIIRLIIAAGVFVLTSVVSFCPLYTLFGIHTCRVDHKKA